MKKTLIIIATLAIASVSFAGEKTKVSCAVMPDHKVDIKKATKDKMFADYNGRRYFFCCGGCPGQFKKDPAKYSKAESIPTPKKGK